MTIWQCDDLAISISRGQSRNGRVVGTVRVVGGGGVVGAVGAVRVMRAVRVMGATDNDLMI